MIERRDELNQMKKALIIILIVFLFVYLLLGLIIHPPWCITRSMDNFGMKEIKPYDVQNASIQDNKVLLLETNTIIRIGRGKKWHHSSITIKLRCDLNASLDSPQDVTDEVKKRDYSNIPGLLGYRQFRNIAETERIFCAKYTQCILEKDTTTLSGQELQLVTDDLLKEMSVPQKTFLYIQGSFVYHPMHKYLIIYNEQNAIIIPISFDGHQRHETWARHFRYVLYPFTVAFDIVTFPIQICQMLFVGSVLCPEWTCGP